MSKSTLTSKGQTTIPADIRAFLGIKPGDELEYVKTKSGKVEIAPKKNYRWYELMSILPKPEKTVTDEAIKASIAAFWLRNAPKESGKG